jgi:hypothetical protein
MQHGDISRGHLHEPSPLTPTELPLGAAPSRSISRTDLSRTVSASVDDGGGYPSARAVRRRSCSSPLPGPTWSAGDRGVELSGSPSGGVPSVPSSCWRQRLGAVGSAVALSTLAPGDLLEDIDEVVVVWSRHGSAGEHLLCRVRPRRIGPPGAWRTGHVGIRQLVLSAGVPPRSPPAGQENAAGMPAA